MFLISKKNAFSSRGRDNFNPNDAVEL